MKAGQWVNNLLASPLIWFAAILLGVALSAWGLREATGPTKLLIAVGPPGSEDAQLAEAIAAHLDHRRGAIRLKVVSVSDTKAAAQSVENRQSDLAIVRSDVALPANSGTMLITHKTPITLIAPPGSKLKKAGDLAGARIAVIPQDPANVTLVQIIAGQGGVLPSALSFVQVQPSELAGAIKDKKVDVVALVAPPSSDLAQQVVASVASAKGGAPRFIKINGDESIAQTHAVYEKATIPEGAFKGGSARPAEELKTLEVSYRLVARHDVSEATIASLVPQIFAMRNAISSKAALASELAMPDTDKGSRFPLHAGAAAYYGDDEKSFMERYGDFFYLGAMVSGGLGSCIAAVFGAIRAEGRRTALALIDHLIEIKDRAREIFAPEDFAAALDRVGELSSQGLVLARDGHFESDGLQALRLAIDEAREAIEERRRSLAREAGRFDPVHLVSANARLETTRR